MRQPKPMTLSEMIKDLEDLLGDNEDVLWSSSVKRLKAVIEALEILESASMSGPFPLTDEGIKQALEAAK